MARRFLLLLGRVPLLRRIPAVRRARAPRYVAEFLSILRRHYSQGHLEELSARESPVFAMLTRDQEQR